MPAPAHLCIGCKRPSYLYDREIGQWVCESNPDCSYSKNVTSEQRAAYEKQQAQEKIVARKEEKQHESVTTRQRRWRK